MKSYFDYFLMHKIILKLRKTSQHISKKYQKLRGEKEEWFGAVEA